MKQRTHTFPKTYTTLGAIYRGKKNYEKMFPTSTFMVVKQEGKFILERIEKQTTTSIVPQQEVVQSKPKVEKKKVVVEYVGDDFDGDPTYEDLNETFLDLDDEELFDDEGDF